MMLHRLFESLVAICFSVAVIAACVLLSNRQNASHFLNIPANDLRIRLSLAPESRPASKFPREPVRIPETDATGSSRGHTQKDRANDFGGRSNSGTTRMMPSAASASNAAPLEKQKTVTPLASPNSKNNKQEQKGRVGEQQSQQRQIETANRQRLTAIQMEEQTRARMRAEEAARTAESKRFHLSIRNGLMTAMTIKLIADSTTLTRHALANRTERFDFEDRPNKLSLHAEITAWTGDHFNYDLDISTAGNYNSVNIPLEQPIGYFALTFKNELEGEPQSLEVDGKSYQFSGLLRGISYDCGLFKGSEHPNIVMHYRNAAIIRFTNISYDPSIKVAYINLVAK